MTGDAPRASPGRRAPTASTPIAFGSAMLASIGFAAFVTWPQARHLATHVAAHHDARFSMWRLSWIAHALRTQPLHLFDANIFHPAANTLAFSDATLLEGFVAAPFLWAGISAPTIYNVLLLGGMAASGLCMFVLARHLTHSAAAGIVSAAVFTMAPYRIEHVMHLELQWTMWMPLTWWMIHRAIERGTWRSGVAAGVCLWLQVLSCVYYGVFLAIITAVLVPLALAAEPRRAVRALVPIVLAAATGILLTLPYLWPYVRAARVLGGRDPIEVARYSARAVNYLAAPASNRLWGWTDARFGGVELRLFPGLLAMVLALIALTARPRRYILIYFGLAVLAVELSFGTHGRVYPWLVSHVPALQGLRSPSRFAILAIALVAVLAGFGYDRVEQRFAGRLQRIGLLIVVLAVMCAEYANRTLPLMCESVPGSAPLYRAIRSAAPGVIVELPMPLASALPGREADYVFWSTAHWRPLVNGYSGYYPAEYIATIERMRSFPDAASIRRLQQLDVRYVIVHRDYMDPKAYAALLFNMASEPALRPYGRYAGPSGEADVFTLER